MKLKAEDLREDDLAILSAGALARCYLRRTISLLDNIEDDLANRDAESDETLEDLDFERAELVNWEVRLANTERYLLIALDRVRELCLRVQRRQNPTGSS